MIAKQAMMELTELAREESTMKAQVVLFKDSGKYYTEEEWQVPEDALGPWDMARSPDFRHIGGGAVLVPAQEPWGFPHLLSAAAAGSCGDTVMVSLPNDAAVCDRLRGHDGRHGYGDLEWEHTGGTVAFWSLTVGEFCCRTLERYGTCSCPEREQHFGW